jgi:hypothetical protein
MHDEAMAEGDEEPGAPDAGGESAAPGGGPEGPGVRDEPARGVPGPGEHQVLDDVGTTVYETAVTHGWIDETDPGYAEGTPQRAAVELLVELGLIRHDPHAHRFHPVDPAGASEHLVVPLALQGAELLEQSVRWSETLSRLSHVYRSSSASLERMITEVHGMEAINRFIDTQLNECRTEFLAAQPHGRRRAATLEQVKSRDLALLQRGASMRSLYQHSARHSTPTREYVAQIGALGAEVRTSDEFSNRLLIFDRRIALIPATENRAVAVAIHDKSVVAFLVDIFERAWERALPFTVEGLVVARKIVAEVRAMTLRMLVEGHSDAASAKRLGVSARTYASYIAALKEEYGVETRFQLGWAMSQSQDDLHGPPPEPTEPTGF